MKFEQFCVRYCSFFFLVLSRFRNSYMLITGRHVTGCRAFLHENVSNRFPVKLS